MSEPSPRRPTPAEYAELLRLRENMDEHTRLYEECLNKIAAMEDAYDQANPTRGIVEIPDV